MGLGLLSYGLGVGLAALGREVVGLREELAVAAALAVMIVINFWANRLLVFRGQGRLSHEFVKFIGASVLMRSFEYGAFISLLRIFGLHYLAAYTIALLVSNVLKFTLYRAVVFRRTPEPAR